MMTTAQQLPADEAGPRAELLDPAVTVRFMLAGDAYVTFQSRKTGNRFTYRVEAKRRPEETVGAIGTCAGGPSHFVSVLVGPDNGRNYKYLGTIFEGRVYAHGKKSTIDKSAASAIAFAWVWRTLTGGRMHEQLAVYHEGRCGACGRRLTTPLSISRGMGASCWERSGV